MAPFSLTPEPEGAVPQRMEGVGGYQGIAEAEDGIGVDRGGGLEPDRVGQGAGMVETAEPAQAEGKLRKGNSEPASEEVLGKGFYHRVRGDGAAGGQV